MSSNIASLTKFILCCIWIELKPCIFNNFTKQSGFNASCWILFTAFLFWTLGCKKTCINDIHVIADNYAGIENVPNGFFPSCSSVGDLVHRLQVQFPPRAEFFSIALVACMTRLPMVSTKDHFHKWRRICYSFVFELIGPNGLTLVSIFFWILPIAERFERSIRPSRKKKMFLVPARFIF